jgi:hypothetical protein
MTLLGFKTILHKKFRESSRKFLGAGLMSSKMKTNFKKSAVIMRKYCMLLAQYCNRGNIVCF